MMTLRPRALAMAMAVLFGVASLTVGSVRPVAATSDSYSSGSQWQCATWYWPLYDTLWCGNATYSWNATVTWSRLPNGKKYWTIKNQQVWGIIAHGRYDLAGKLSFAATFQIYRSDGALIWDTRTMARNDACYQAGAFASDSYHAELNYCGSLVVTSETAPYIKINFHFWPTRDVASGFGWVASRINFH